MPPPTITVTEAGYLRGADGHLDASRDVVVADVDVLRSDPREQVGSLPARLVAGLVARRAAGAEALTILSCDNLPENGPVTQTVVKDLAAFWDEASRYLTLPASDIADYRAALVTRFSNPRVRHQLAQIAPDGSIKLRVRTLPTVRAERSAGRVPTGCATTIAAWVLHLRGLGAPIKDPGAGPAQLAANSGDLPEAVPAVLDVLDAGLGSDSDFVDAVISQADAIQSQ
jgi:mannitol-1-phosphate/altronate dehydrogenase